ncbi:MAG: hypothetical protein AABX99_03295 [Nanoarchaeota archaeon]
MNKLQKALCVGVSALTLSLTGCDDASVVRQNLEREEQNFKVYRRVIFYNGITNDYILTMEGNLAIIVDGDGDLVVTVKTQEGEYLKHYLGLSDNVTYFSEALRSNDVSDKSYKVIFKPSVIVPTIEKR